MDKEIQLDEFENYLKFQNMSENTIRSYLYAIRQYYKLFPELTYSNLQLYKLYLLEHYKPQTVNLRIHALNCFLNYSEWPDEKILQVRIQQKGYLDRIISEGDYEYLKSRLLSDGQYLYYFLIRFMAATGARVSEVVQIKAEHLRLGYMDLYSKGGKIRRIYFPDRLCTEGLEWLKSKGTASGFIFLNQQGKQITPRGINSQLKRLARRYHIDPDTVYPHSFRQLSDVSSLSAEKLLSGEKEQRFLLHHLKAMGLPASKEALLTAPLSDGQQKSLLFLHTLFSLSRTGGVVIADDLTVFLHPNVSRYLVQLIQSPRNSNIQLLFTTHDTALLDHDLFRRDEAAIINLDAEGRSRIHTLADIRIRFDANFAREYLSGKYGLLPVWDQEE